MDARTKGRRFEKVVADLWARYGFAVRNLEHTGDHLLVSRDGLVLGQECKRRERIALQEWWRQTIADAPRETVPVLTLKWNKGEILSVIRTEDLARLLRAAVEREAAA